MVYARYAGLGSLLPISEPVGTFGFAILGFGMLFLRRRRRDLTTACVRVQAEVQAFDRIRPQFARAREELDAQITRLAAEVDMPGLKRADARSRVMRRALDRLGDLRGKLGDLVSDDLGTSVHEAERRLIEHDSQLGAIVLAGIAVALAVPVLVWSETQLGGDPTPMFLVSFSIALVILLYLVSTRRRPSSHRALIAIVVLFATAYPAITINQHLLLSLDRPYSPFLGHKLLMGVLGLSLTTRFKLGVVLIVMTAANAIVLWFILDLGAHRDIVPFAEPWVTVIYMFVGLVSLFLLEQRQITSIKLMRARAEASAMHRRAVMFLALRDRLNSPLQTLVLGAAAATMDLPPSQGERVQAAIDRLVALSHELSELDGLVPPLATTIDADYELRRQV
jgi:MYXO-CTERM domain-containing protein